MPSGEQVCITLGAPQKAGTEYPHSTKEGDPEEGTKVKKTGPRVHSIPKFVEFRIDSIGLKYVSV